MRRIVLFVTLAAVLVIALGAVPAYAKYAGFSSTTQYIGWTTAVSLASNNADAAIQDGTPHAGYGTTTIKCAVCHSVHRGSRKLLNSGASCAVCHTNTYYGGTAFATTISWKVTSGGGPHASCGSDYCHGGPHGVDASIYDGPASKLMRDSITDDKLTADALANGVALSTLDTWNATTRALSTGALCSRDGCHSASAFGVINAGSMLSVTPGVVGLTSATGHRVIATDSSNWNANGTDFPSGKTGLKIAWKPVSYCSSCHDLTDDNNGGKAAFPHAINDVISTAQSKEAGKRAAIWLTAAPNSASQSLAVSGYDQYTVAAGDSVVEGAAGLTVLDGICLKCHRSATSGIGIDF